MDFYRSAASQEHPGAMYNLGIYYGQGRGGLVRDMDTATRLLRLAALKGKEEAAIALKALDIDISEPLEQNVESFSFPYTPYAPAEEHIMPTHSSLFVDNVQCTINHATVC